MRILGAILLSLPLCTLAQVNKASCVRPQTTKASNCLKPVPKAMEVGMPLKDDGFRFNVGLKAGVLMDIHDISGNLTIPGADASAGFHTGIFTRFRSNWFSVQPELGYGFSSHEYEIGNATSPALETPAPKADVRLHRFDLPVLAQFHVGDYMRLNVGPQYTFRRSRINTTSGVYEREWRDAENDKLTSSLFNIRTGIGADIGRLTLDLSYDVNLNEYGINDFPVGGTTISPDDRIHTLIFSVGVKFLDENFFP